MPQDAKGGAHVEVGIRKHEGPEKVLPFKDSLTSSHACWDGESDLPPFGPIKVDGINAFHETDASADPLEQLFHVRFVVVHHRCLATGESGHAATGDVRCDLHLTGAVEHVRIKAARQQHLNGEATLLGVDFGPFQQMAEVAEVLHQGWNQGSVEGARQRGLGHGLASLASSQQ